MSILWEKILSYLKKYWQIFIGLFAGLGFALNMWWKLRSQKKVLQNEIETNAKIRTVEESFLDKVENIEKKANETNDARLVEIKNKQNKKIETVKKEFDDRVKKNKDTSNQELADKIGESFDVNVIQPEE